VFERLTVATGGVGASAMGAGMERRDSVAGIGARFDVGRVM
jgi:hypothetical protein